MRLICQVSELVAKKGLGGLSGSDLGPILAAAVGLNPLFFVPKGRIIKEL
jgi:hypothetical protein